MTRGLIKRLASVAMLATVASGSWVAASAGPLTGNASAAAKPSYVALGDSYASGVGTGVFYHANAGCYQSPDAYSALLAKAKGYTLTFAACSGATTADVLSSQLRGLGRSTGLVTVQVGGNDAHLITVLEDCALHQSICDKAISLADSYIKHSLAAVLSRTYARIRAAAPRAEVVVVGYPHLFTPSGASCGLKVLSSSRERSFNQTADLLDGVLELEATRHHFKFLDPRAGFQAHEICTSAPWVNDANLAAIPESYHPNIAGEAGYAKLLERTVGGSVV